jgi:hypothetical protein
MPRRLLPVHGHEYNVEGLEAGIKEKCAAQTRPHKGKGVIFMYRRHVVLSGNA